MIVAGASGGIGAGMFDAFPPAGYAVVGTGRSMASSDDPDLLTAASMRRAATCTSE